MPNTVIGAEDILENTTDHALLWTIHYPRGKQIINFKKE